MNEENDRVCVGVLEAARMLSVSPRTIWSLLAAGRISALRLGRRTLIPVAQVRALAEDADDADVPSVVRPTVGRRGAVRVRPVT